MKKNKKILFLTFTCSLVFGFTGNKQAFAATEEEPKYKDGQTTNQFYSELQEYYLNNGYVIRNDAGLGGLKKQPSEYSQPFYSKSIKRFPKERPNKPDFKFMFGSGYGLYQSIRPLYTYDGTQFGADYRTTDSDALANFIPNYYNVDRRPQNDTQNLTFTLLPFVYGDEGADFTKYTPSISNGKRKQDPNVEYETYVQGMTFLEFDSNKEAQAKPVQFNWAKDSRYSNIFWNMKEEKAIFLAQNNKGDKILKMSFAPNLKQQNFTNEFEMYNLSGTKKIYRLLYNSVFEHRPSANLVTNSVPYYSLGVDKDGKPKGFYSTNTGTDKTILSWRVDGLQYPPENFVVTEATQNIPFINGDWGPFNESAHTVSFLQPVSAALNSYNPSNALGTGAEAVPKNGKFGEMINARNPADYGQFKQYASGIGFKSPSKELSKGQSITMQFGTGVDTLYDKPAISEYSEMDKKEDEDFVLKPKWFDQNAKSSGLTIQPYLNNEKLDIIQIQKDIPEATQGEFDFVVPKEKFNIGKPNVIKFIIKDSEYNELLGSTDKQNVPHYNEMQFTVNNLRKVSLNYKDTRDKSISTPQGYEDTKYALDGSKVEVTVPLTVKVGEKELPLEGILPDPAVDKNITLNPKTGKITIAKLNENYKTGISVIYKVLAVNAKISRIEQASNQFILEDIKASTPSKIYDLDDLEIDSDLNVALEAAQNQKDKPLKLDYEGYTKLDGYKVFVKGEEVTPTPTKVPNEDFEIKYFYNGEVNITKVPELSFGDDKGNLLISNDESKKYSLQGNDEESTVEMYDTRNSVDTKMTVELKGDILNKAEKKYNGELQFKKEDSSEPLSISEGKPVLVMSSKKEKHFNTFSLKGPANGMKGLYMVQYSGNYSGDFTGTLVWKVTPDTAKETAK